MGLRGKRNIRAQAVGRFMENDEFALAVGENGRRHLRAGVAATGSAWMADNTLSLSYFRWGLPFRTSSSFFSFFWVNQK